LFLDDKTGSIPEEPGEDDLGFQDDVMPAEQAPVPQQ